ncbi:MAG: hypothetical protein ACRDZR_05685 [Acidimicrobiales bacterium]
MDQIDPMVNVKGVSGYHLVRVIRRFGADCGAPGRFPQDHGMMDAVAPDPMCDRTEVQFTE